MSRYFNALRLWISAFAEMTRGGDFPALPPILVFFEVPYSRSPGWHCGTSHIFSNVEKRIAFTLPDLRREIFCFEIPTFAASSRERFTPLVKDLDIREMAASKPLAERIPPCEIRP